VQGLGEVECGVTPYSTVNFDLRLQDGELPYNLDGVIGSLRLLDVARVAEYLEDERFKFNAVPVITDWLIRYGQVNSDETDYLMLRKTLLLREPH
jgi:hypothetical protein